MEILERFNVQAPIIAHSRKVALLACFLAFALNQKGYEFDLELITAAGLLHDLAKGEPNHALAGGKKVCELGYPKVGEIISQHNDITLKDMIDEAQILYLVDKLIIEDKIVTLDKRFQRALEKYGSKDKVKENILTRQKNATLIKEKIEKALNKTLGPDLFAEKR